MTLITQIADAVVAELNTGPFTPAIAATRYYRPQFELAGLKTVQVSVVPRSMTIEGATRAANQHDVQIDVAVQKKVNASDAGELDGLMRLVEQISDHLRLKRLGAYPQAVWAKTENAPIYSPEHLEQKQVFTSVLTLTYRVVK